MRGEGPAVITAQPKLIRRKREPVRQVHAEQRRIEEVLRKRLGTDIRITAKRRGRGTISIRYYSNDDLVRLLELILGQPYNG